MIHENSLAPKTSQFDIPSELSNTVNNLGILRVLELITEITYEKAEHIESNWQDADLAGEWNDFANALSNAVATLTDFVEPSDHPIALELNVAYKLEEFIDSLGLKEVVEHLQTYAVANAELYHDLDELDANEYWAKVCQVLAGTLIQL